MIGFKSSKKSSKSLAGPGYIVLNGIRALNIIALLSVAVASWVMIVMNIKTNHFFFFDAIAHLITSIISIFLIISEANLFSSYFEKNWPKFSNESGFVFLGLSMIVLGFNILSNLNKSATNIDTLGLPMWRIVIASGIVVSLMGVINIVATYIFCDSKRNITGRQVRSHGAAIPLNNFDKTDFTVRSNSTRSNNTRQTPLPMYNPPAAPEDNRRSKFGFRFPIRTSHISRPTPQISHPIPTNMEQFNKWHARSEPVSDVEHGHEDKADEMTVVSDRASPISPDIQRPPTSAHPMYRNQYPPPPPSPSRYSVVSNITRWTRGGF